MKGTHPLNEVGQEPMEEVVEIYLRSFIRDEPADRGTKKA